MEILAGWGSEKTKPIQSQSNPMANSYLAFRRGKRIEKTSLT